MTDEPDTDTPWSTGLVVTVLSAALMFAAIFAFGTALSLISPWLSLAVNLVAIGGVVPTVWRWRRAPTVRWLVYGFAVAVPLAWLALLVAAL